ncbi:MAG TPA: PorV/PorQ family protein, partial [Bacteroidota bacterium]
MKRLLLFTGCALVLVHPLSQGQGVINVSKSGTVAATFLEIPVGAAAVGLGGAFVSLANDATALYWNPAGTATFQHAEALVQHTAWIGDTKHDFAALVVPLGSFGTLGLSFISLSMSDMAVRTVDRPEGTGEFFSAGDIAIGISYARTLSDRFSIGFTGKYIQQSIWHESANAIALDAGTTFRTDLLGGLTIGAALTNFGTTMQMSGRDTRQF